jgi:hypothetical protein
LFDTLILPILTYGCEVWGYENNKQLEKLHLQYCRNILGVRTTTANVMTYRELGRTPIDICIQLRIVKFWNRLISNEKKLIDRKIFLTFLLTTLSLYMLTI